MKRRPSVSFVVVNTLLVWLTTAVAATTFWPIYQHPQLIVLVSVTIALGSAIAILGAVFRWPSYVRDPGHLRRVPRRGRAARRARAARSPGCCRASTASSSCWGRSPSAGSSCSPSRCRSATTRRCSCPRSCSSWRTTVTALSVALRAQWGELGVIAPIVLFVAGIAFGPATAPWPIALSLVMLASTLLWLVWRRWRRRRDAIRSLVSKAPDATGQSVEATTREGLPAWRPILIGGLILAVASVSSVAATRALPPPGSTDVLRTTIVQPFDPRDYSSPLAGFRRYLRFDKVDVGDDARHRPAGGRAHPDRDSRQLRRGRLRGGKRRGGQRLGNLRAHPVLGRPDRRWTATSCGSTSRSSATRASGCPRSGSSRRSGSRVRGRRRSTTASSTTTRAGPAPTSGSSRRDDRYQLDAVLPPARTDSELVRVTPGSAVVPRTAVIPEGVAQEARRLPRRRGVAGRAASRRDRRTSRRGLHQPRHRSRMSRSADPDTPPTGSPSCSRPRG